MRTFVIIGNNVVQDTFIKAGLYTFNATIKSHLTAQKNSDITKAEIEAKLTGAITSHTHSYVGLSGAETVAGVKTFSSIPVLPPSNPTSANQATRKSYVDAQVATKAALGETSSTAYRGDRGKIAYDHSQTAHTPSDAQKNSDITKAEIEIALGYTPLPQSGGILNDYVEKLVIIDGTNSINLDEGNTFLKTISADTTFSIANPKAGAHSFTLIIEMNTLSALTFPAEIEWQDGEAPDMSEANKTYILTFLTIDNGLTWFGMKRGAFKVWNGIFADPEVGRVLHANGLIASPTHSTCEELATITSLNPSGTWEGSYFYNNKVITQFPELKYFTGVTNLTYTFQKCSSLTTAPVIPSSVTNLSGTFQNCSSLTTAPVIPSSVTNLTGTFLNCSSIDGIYIINIVTPIYYSGSLSNVQAIYVPDASVSAYKSASGWTQFASKIYPMSDKPQ